MLLVGYYGYQNFGDEWLLNQTIRLIRHHNKKQPIKVVQNNQSEQSVPRYNLWKLFHAIRQTDAVVFGGGSLFQTRSSWRSVWYYAAIMAIAMATKLK